ncbi:uncharacterized protein LOC131002941 [Salvia miltiorrhiza]|uniref:uncharacterized protein LOC131002941 n=1 Tax=Salvia miltiorrhiza TaxID=226208 RepID=UPI0025AC56FE|nr:uncharacterized protein LOC131002941 [Salvia miltiorrhiza]
MAQNTPTCMGNFARPIIEATNSAIVLPTAVRNYILKPNDANLLPLYHGMPSEDALNFIRDVCTQVQTFPLLNITEDQLTLKCFQYALKDRARSWLLSLPPNSITTWNEACEKFMLKYYPNHKTQELRTKIMEFTQEADEPFHEAWDRFQELLRQCPQHQLAPTMVSQFFYDGLGQTSQFIVDSTAGGNIARKTAEELNQIFQTLAESSQQKLVRGKRVEASAVSQNGDLQKQLASIMREVQQLKMSKMEPPPVPVQSVHPCGICGDLSHGVDQCNRMGEFTPEGQAEVYSAQGFQSRPDGQSRLQYGQSNNQGHQNFNGGWRGQQSYAPQPNNSQQYPPRYQQQGNFQRNQRFQNAQ